MMQHELFPARKHLKRIPVWLPDDQSVYYFLTLCCARRRRIFLNSCHVRMVFASLLKTADKLRWNISYVCFMPDHVHLVVAPKEIREQSLSQLIQRWKSSSTQRLHGAGVVGEVWQREFFDHLLRSDESLQEKWNYVMMNPVRAGLCSTPDQFPYLGTPEEVAQKNKWQNL